MNDLMGGMTPSEYIQNEFVWPFEFRPYQNESIDDLVEYQKAGYYLPVGGGKTVVGFAAALYQAQHGRCEQIVIICPPILLDQWYDFVEEISALNGSMFNSLVYRGTPGQRRIMALAKQDVIIMSIQILKNDFRRLQPYLNAKKVTIILDEAQAIRNVSTKNYKAIRDVSETNNLMMLTGTPINNPLHCYAYIKQLFPEAYRSIKMFRNVHVAKEDFYGAATEFQNLDMLKSSLEVQAKIYDSADVIPDLPDIVYSVIQYDLSPTHAELYKKLVREELLVLEEEVIDATTAQNMYHKLQKLVLNPGIFSDQKVDRPVGLDVLDETLDELQLDGPLAKDKLIIFCNYRPSNELIYEYLEEKFPGQNRICYGGKLGGTGKNPQYIKEFLNDPNVKYMVASPKSIGVGLNLQSACRYILFMETPLTSNDFNQAYQRVVRSGQDMKCTVKFAVARHTIQEKIVAGVREKEALVQQLTPTQQNLLVALKDLA